MIRDFMLRASSRSHVSLARSVPNSDGGTHGYFDGVAGLQAPDGIFLQTGDRNVGRINAKKVDGKSLEVRRESPAIADGRVGRGTAIELPKSKSENPHQPTPACTLTHHRKAISPF